MSDDIVNKLVSELFDAKKFPHGGPSVRFDDGSTLYPDGSMSSGGLFQPPPEPRYRGMAKLKYWRRVLERAERDANHLAVAIGPAVWGRAATPWHYPTGLAWEIAFYGPPLEGQAMLAKIRKVVEKVKAILAELRPSGGGEAMCEGGSYGTRLY